MLYVHFLVITVRVWDLFFAALDPPMQKKPELHSFIGVGKAPPYLSAEKFGFKNF